MSKYKYLLFDADNTLLDFNTCEKHAFAETFVGFNLPFNDEIYGLYHVINDSIWKELEKGQIERDALKFERFRRLFEKIGIENIDCRELAKTYEKNLSEQYFEFEGAYELISELSEKYDLYIITNGTTCVQENRFKKSRLTPMLKNVFISEKMGVAKPDVEFFNKVFEFVGDFDRSKYLVIGDSLSSDIQGAVNSDLDCIWLNREGADGGDRQITYIVKSFSEIKALLIQ